MPYATNDGVRIYYEREGTGSPVILHHGFTLAHQIWRTGRYVDALRADHELILLDPCGHGASDKPHDSAAYTFDKRVADVTAVMDDAGIERAVFWGYSMGGHVGYAIAHYAPERFNALIVGGSHPYQRDGEVARQLVASLRRDGMASFLAALERQFGALPAAFRTLVLANDAEALAACEVASGDAPSFADSLGTVAIPMLIYVGERDGAYTRAEQAAAGNPRIAFIGLPGLDHLLACELQGETVVPHVRTFLTTVDRARST